MKNDSLRVPIFTLTFARLVVNMTRRFPYAILNEISRRLGVPLSSVQDVMAFNAGIGLASPFFGPLSERHGRKRVMLAALAIMAGAAAFGALVPHFALFATVMIVFGVGKIIFDPAMQAYMGDNVPYVRRASAIGMTELSWAGALLIAAPAGAFLLSRFGLSAIFLALVVLFIAAIAAVKCLLPDDHHTSQHNTPIMPWQAWRMLGSHSTALGALVYIVLVGLANEIFLINYSTWMERSFELSVAALGNATIAIAAGEVCGEFAVIFLADRFGSRRVAMIAVTGAALCYLLLPVLATNLNLALLGIFLLYVFVETGIVASIPLMTEVMPQARSIMMSGVVAASSVGRMLGALIGSSLFALIGDFRAMGIVETAIAVIALMLLWRYLREASSFNQ